MASWLNQLSQIRSALLCLSTPQTELVTSLEALCTILVQLAAEDAGDEGEDVKERCFSDGIAKALLGILRSSNRNELLVSSCKCLALIAHGSEESRLKLGDMGTIHVLVDVLSECLETRERVLVCEQAILCLRKITYHNVTNQVELARKGGIKLTTTVAMDTNFMTNGGQFSSEAIKQVEKLVLRKKFIAKVKLIKDAEKNEILLAFPSIRSFSLAKSYPVFSVDLVTKDKVLVSEKLIESGTVWPAEEVPMSDFKWTVVVVQAVEMGNSLWCQFCRGNQEQAMLDMRKTLDSLVGCRV